MNYYLIDFENVKTDGIKDLHGVHKGDVMTFSIQKIVITSLHNHHFLPLDTTR